MLDQQSTASLSVQGTDPATHLRFNAQQVRQCFDKEPFLITHDLATHPLLQLPRLIQLSKTLPQESVEYNAGDLPVNQDSVQTPRTGLSIEETLRQIEKCRSWLVLKNVEQDSQYRQLLDECLNQVQPVIEVICPGMTARKAFIFVSSPAAVTPYHADFEYNFLLQIRGGKSITVFDGQDRTLFTEVERERAVNGAPRNLDYRPEIATHGQAFKLDPGIGVHVPLSSPHWVKVANEVSISFSITFHSRASDKRIGLHRANALLRRFGISPNQVGESAKRDALKYIAYRSLRKLRSIGARLSRSTVARGTSRLPS